ncbi:hypothetical protein DEU56DRAFT_742110 [Suillus clintonianus]|uniref:uncharacterized protein n=1 Tax=Suillus clintonianus TaxID=1904413 RepID=UPI001B870E2C|nr:uncharacterized protein DEU56DRAFT_742110 [Suillus clintonianus]KAG2128260.1 hypothetical protein DEU56DRAFT_742110 [Suillus clintonianus]
MDSFNTFHSLIKAVTLHAWKQETLEGYQGGINRFRSFCASNNIPISLPIPEWVLCAFAAQRAGTCSGSSVANDIFGLRAWHIANGAIWLGGTHLKYMLRSAVRLTPDSSKHPPRPPVSSEMLDVLHASLDNSIPLHACVLACADAVFWGQGRLGEFLPTSQSRFSPKFFPTPSSLRNLSSSGESLMCRLPWTKVAKEKGEDIFLGRQLGASDPISALLAHLVASPAILSAPHSSHLFTYDVGGGKLVSLTKRKFLLICNAVWNTHNMPHISRHCFRIGGTMELLLRNVPPHIVKVMGRWSSDSFLRYWCLLEHIAPLHAELLGPKLTPLLAHSLRSSSDP